MGIVIVIGVGIGMGIGTVIGSGDRASDNDKG